eukprot:scaffold4914_cov108-Cylindrotheca_fusiformis.AAC.4
MPLAAAEVACMRTKTLRTIDRFKTAMLSGLVVVKKRFYRNGRMRWSVWETHRAGRSRKSEVAIHLLIKSALVVADHVRIANRNLRIYGERTVDRWDEYDLQQIEMSMPTTPAPVPVTPAPFTASPTDRNVIETVSPTDPGVVETVSPTPPFFSTPSPTEPNEVETASPTDSAVIITPSPTAPPTRNPTDFPTTAAPVLVPTTSTPTLTPTQAPTLTPTFEPTEDPTRFPSDAPTTIGVSTPTPTAPTLPALFLDEDGVFEPYELLECQGGMSNAAKKKTILCDLTSTILTERDFGVKDVPGCSGDADFIGDGFDNFCVRPESSITLVITGDNGVPADAFPLGQCRGDCDADEDCADGLICFQRDGVEAVPGCVGDGESTFDYCFSNVPPLDFIGDFEMDFYQLGVCQGDCDFDSDCELGLVCYFREAGVSAVPGCGGDANQIGTGEDDFCIERPSDSYLVILADDDLPGNFPLPSCAGDCDADEDCQDGLSCFFRDGLTPVPGCEGDGEFGFDYCTSLST